MRPTALGTRFPAIDFDAFHRTELPRRLAAGHGRLAGPDVAGVPPLAVVLPDGCGWTYEPAAGEIALRPGVADAGTVVQLAGDDFTALVYELSTVAGLYYAGALTFLEGDHGSLERWEPALRAMYDGRPIFDRSHVRLRDEAGRALDPARRFGLDDPDRVLAHVLHETGFLVLRAVFEPDEVQALAAEVDRLAGQARPGDRRSWWTAVAGGGHELCRLTYAGLRSERIRALIRDDRLRRIAALVSPELTPRDDRCDGQTVVMKVPGATTGLADLPWHRDCGLGGHPVMCPNLQVGLQLTPATEATGRLWFLAGGWRMSCHRHDLADPTGLPIVPVDAAPGDVTVHFGDTLHAAPPPTGDGPGRRTLYTSFFSPRTRELIGAGQGYNDVLLGRDDGLVVATG